ncbi:MAG: MFS transporter [Chloroflexi bacterium]|nr:MFS transporter [Chloroflexota bacterium]
MKKPQASPTFLLLLLALSTSLTSLSLLMLGPLLVALAEEFDTSVAVVGQLAGASAITWGITAFLIGPISDTYGRRLVLLTGAMLMGVGILGSVVAWNYGSLLGFRLLVGVAAAMIPANAIAAVADIFPPERRGKAIGWIITATGISATIGVAIVAFLLDVGGWRLPFYVIGGIALVIWALLWVWFPQSQKQPGQSLSFFSHYREVGANATVWYVLASNALLQMAFFGVLSYLAANLIQTYGMTAGETVLPLALAGLGVITGGFIGGRIADSRRRLNFLTIAALLGGLLATFVFVGPVSPWLTVAFAFGVATSLRISSSVTPTLLLEMAGSSRSTATGMFAVSNQIGVFGGASIGGAMLAMGGFPMVGFFCLGAAGVGGALILLKVRDPAEFLERIALREASNDPAKTTT